jgi:hypothetical protein
MAKKRNKLARPQLAAQLDPEVTAALLSDGIATRMHPERVRELWAQHRDELLDAWTRERPGSRPQLWWTHDAPEPRRQLSGHGIRVEERFRNFAPMFDHGVPLFDSIDDSNPPMFESEAAFLQRHNLLVPGERRRIDPSQSHTEQVG